MIVNQLRRCRQHRFHHGMTINNNEQDNNEDSTTTTTTNNGNNNNNNDDDKDSPFFIDWSTVELTDEEVLLACRAYLQRHHQLEWTEREYRRDMIKQTSAMNDGGGIGYFWPDPSELKYFNNKDAIDDTYDPYNDDDDDFFSGDDDDDDVVYEDAEGNRLATEASSFLKRVGLDDGMSISGTERVFSIDQDDDGSVTGGIFTGLPSGPSKAFKNRSEAKTRMWADPEFRKMWYEKRWGNHTKVDKRKQRIERKVDGIPTETLESGELASMTMEEIQNAITTYIVSNRKRSVKRKAMYQKEAEQRNETIAESLEKQFPKDGSKVKRVNTEESDGITAFLDDFLKERQRKRSEKSRRAYQTRLANQRKRAGITDTKVDGPTNKQGRKMVVLVDDGEEDDNEARWRKPLSTPKEAIDRIVRDLDMGLLPLTDDIRLMMRTGRLAGRKHVLRRILLEHFDMRGKCVPSDLNDRSGTGKMEFVTKALVPHLASFVLRVMEEAEEAAERQNENGDDDDDDGGTGYNIS